MDGDSQILTWICNKRPGPPRSRQDLDKILCKNPANKIPPRSRQDLDKIPPRFSPRFSPRFFARFLPRFFARISLISLRDSLHEYRQDDETAGTVACSTVGARLDYCNSILYGTSAGNLGKIQRVINTLARVVSGARKCDHITPVLADLHWLPIASRIRFEVAL